MNPASTATETAPNVTQPLTGPEDTSFCAKIHQVAERCLECLDAAFEKMGDCMYWSLFFAATVITCSTAEILGAGIFIAIPVCALGFLLYIYLSKRKSDHDYNKRINECNTLKNELENIFPKIGELKKLIQDSDLGTLERNTHVVMIKMQEIDEKYKSYSTFWCYDDHSSFENNIKNIGYSAKYIRDTIDSRNEMSAEEFNTSMVSLKSDLLYWLDRAEESVNKQLKSIPHWIKQAKS